MPYRALSEQLLQSQDGLFERKVWTLPAITEQPAAALLFLDAELYIERMDAPAIVRRLQEQRMMPPAATMFISHNDGASRHADYTCSPAYAAYIVNDVVVDLRRQFPSVTDIVLVGLSLSGLAAAYIATSCPELFRVAICQSPSFWWERGRFAEELPSAVRPGQEFWICVGDRETEAGVSHEPSGLRQESTQIAGCQLAADAFRARGYSISHRLYDGGHDPDCWSEDLALALPWAWRRTKQRTS